MDLGLTGKTALITGASRGIGTAVAQTLAEEGCSLRLVARDAEALQTLAGRLRRDHAVEVETIPADLTAPGSTERLVDAVGPVDILVNNAGDVPAGSLLELDEPSWRRGWELKLFGYIALTRAYYGVMTTAGSGVILNNIGISGERVRADYIAGSSANAALMAFTRALGSTSLDHGIRVLAVNPGPVATDRIVTLTRNAARVHLGDTDRYQELIADYPLGRAAHPREVADVIAFLASPRCGYVSGTVVTVDGGFSARA